MQNLSRLLSCMLCCIPLLVSCAKTPEKDYDLYKNMQEYLLAKFQAMPGFETRDDIVNDFDDYVLKLTLIPRLVFGNSQLEVHLYPEESDHMATGCISQFEDRRIPETLAMLRSWCGPMRTSGPPSAWRRTQR